MPTDQSEITALLDEWTSGKSDALEKLMPLIVEDLRRMARHQMAGENVAHTLEPTALVSELYLRLAGRRTVSWKNRAQFFAFVARTMRRILVDHARARQASKRGSGGVRLSLDESLRAPIPEKDPDLLALDEALEELARLDARQARIVELRYFTGLSVVEVAEVEDISPTTVKREWRTARLWLVQQLRQ